MSELLTQADLVTREQQNRIDRAMESGPTIPGLEELGDMEAELKKLQADIAAKKAGYAAKLRSLENTQGRLAEAKRRLKDGDQLFEGSKSAVEQIETAIYNTVGHTGAIELSKRNQAVQLHLFNERFVQVWPKLRKRAVAEVKRLEAEVESMQKGESK